MIAIGSVGEQRNALNTWKEGRGRETCRIYLSFLRLEYNEAIRVRVWMRMGNTVSRKYNVYKISVPISVKMSWTGARRRGLSVGQTKGFHTIRAQQDLEDG